jgi:hypothetical protein
MRAGDRPHEQDDREHHQPRCDDRRREADLPLGVQNPATGGHEHQEEGSQQLREQPPVLQLRIVELRARAELEHQQVARPPRIVEREGRGFLNGHEAQTRCAGMIAATV